MNRDIRTDTGPCSCNTCASSRSLAGRKPSKKVSCIDAQDLTLIIPTLNESGSIGFLLEKLTAYYNGMHIIVSDDGSVDGTEKIVRGFPGGTVTFLDRRHKSDHGLTASVLEATRLVKTDYFAVIDGDLQHP
jgi:glycosyltransferase involved in cell wall biosynthesis